MENLSPTLTLLLDVRAALENGTSVRTGIHIFLKKSRDPFSQTVSIWLLKQDQGQDPGDLIAALHPCRRALLVVLEKGLRGTPILNHLIELEKEIVRSCEDEMDEQIQKLPIKLMIPVLFFMFPAYLLLLLGPVLLKILNELN